MHERVEILLVEDDPNDVELTLRALRKADVTDRVEVARDGAEALDFVFCTGAFASRSFENAPRVVFLDLKLPKLAGIEVLKRLKADPRTRRIPVVVLTSSREAPDVLASYDCGANGYVVKPVDSEQFSEALRSAAVYWLRVNQPPPPEPES